MIPTLGLRTEGGSRSPQARPAAAAPTLLRRAGRLTFAASSDAWLEKWCCTGGTTPSLTPGPGSMTARAGRRLRLPTLRARACRPPRRSAGMPSSAGAPRAPTPTSRWRMLGGGAAGAHGSHRSHPRRPAAAVASATPLMPRHHGQRAGRLLAMRTAKTAHPRSAEATSPAPGPCAAAPQSPCRAYAHQLSGGRRWRATARLTDSHSPAGYEAGYDI